MQSNSIKRAKSSHSGPRVDERAGIHHGGRVRWEQLFSDLEGRFDDLVDADMMAELADRERVAAGAISMAARIAGALDHPVRVRTAVGITVTGALRRLGPDWLLLVEGAGREVLVASAGVTIIEGLSGVTGTGPSGVELRLDLRFALRGLARDRSPVALVVAGGTGEPTSLHTEITGTIDRLGADFLEIALHAPWEPRRVASVRSVVLVPLAALVLVRALPLG